MKHILEFHLPDEAYDLHLATLAPHMACALEDIYTYLRGATKYADPPPGAVEIRAKFHEILVEYGVDGLV